MIGVVVAHQQVGILGAEGLLAKLASCLQEPVTVRAWRHRQDDVYRVPAIAAPVERTAFHPRRGGFLDHPPAGDQTAALIFGRQIAVAGGIAQVLLHVLRALGLARDPHHHFRGASSDAGDGLQVLGQRRATAFVGLIGRPLPPADRAAQQAIQGFERLAHSQPSAGAQRAVAVSTNAWTCSRKAVTADVVCTSTGSRSARASSLPWCKDRVSWLRLVPTIESW